MRNTYLIPSPSVKKPCWKLATAIGTHALTEKNCFPSKSEKKPILQHTPRFLVMTLDMDSFDFGTLIICFPMAHWHTQCQISRAKHLWPEPRRDPTPFTRTCASRMAPCLHQTSIIFRQVEILLAHRPSQWTNSEAGNSNISIYYAFNVRLIAKSWQPYACLQ